MMTHGRLCSLYYELLLHSWLAKSDMSQVVRIADSSQLRARILVCYPYISTPDAYFREFGIPEASLNFPQLRTERGRGVPAWCLLNVLRISSARIAYALLSGFLVSNSMSFTR
ncbi:unnamed protein product [Coffea canephora]|uniref:Uncharacterized protein n=1 Tax=Coffea canephora TaxID=49390 RepID=A0A068UNY8_COFCA|nr:unnamed protein product [Coffea canephora]